MRIKPHVVEAKVAQMLAVWRRELLAMTKLKAGDRVHLTHTIEIDDPDALEESAPTEPAADEPVLVGP